MQEVISLKFKDEGREYYFSPEKAKYNVGDLVVVETSKGVECGKIVKGNHNVEDEKVIEPLKKVLRLADDKDNAKLEQNKQKAQKAFKVCEEKIIAHGLDMKLVDVDVAFDNGKITFFFTSDGRVDFRELVKDLAGIFHAKIELRQIGVRDEAKMLGGLGLCGQPYCCSRFLDDFQPVSIKMAKEQGLSLNPTKISGCCGRLMCCLKYEQNAYDDLLKRTPKVGSIVKTPDGTGTVVDVSLLKGILTVNIDDGIPGKYQLKDIEIIKSHKKNKD